MPYFLPPHQSKDARLVHITSIKTHRRLQRLHKAHLHHISTCTTAAASVLSQQQARLFILHTSTMEESIDFQISLCPIAPLRVLALTLLALGRMFLSLMDVLSEPQLLASPDPEYRHLFAPLPWLLRRLMGIHPLFIAPPRSYMITRARKKSVVGAMLRHLQRLDELEVGGSAQK
jgi:hypothetical protein